MLDHKSFVQTVWPHLQAGHWSYVWQAADVLNRVVCQTVNDVSALHFTRKILHDLINPQDLPAVLWDLNGFCRDRMAEPLTLRYRLRQASGHYQAITEHVSWQQNGQILSKLLMSDACAETAAAMPTILEQNSPLETFLAAWRDDRLCLAYQPIINSRTGQPAFYECLMRLQTQDGNTLPAAAFIQTVEAHGLTRLIDMTCLRLALNELRDYPALSLSINVATATFTDPEWIRYLEDRCRNDASIAQRLIVEITEHDLMTDIESTCQTLARVRQLGVRTALDDFGAGQTSLRHLVQLPISILKLDRRFISQMSELHSNLFVGNLQNLAKGLGLVTVAEGAESLSDIQRLQQLGVDHIQGYAVGMPSLTKAWEDAPRAKKTEAQPRKLRSVK
jgi:EAL domain-containing protein (putative c-di-GMP-specific phosphodiesterase class I)